MARYEVETNWNRRLSFKGEGSAVMCHVVLASVPENFVRHKGLRTWGLYPPSLGDVLELEVGDSLSGAVEDDTGRASWSIIRRD